MSKSPSSAAAEAVVATFHDSIRRDGWDTALDQCLRVGTGLGGDDRGAVLAAVATAVRSEFARVGEDRQLQRNRLFHALIDSMLADVDALGPTALRELMALASPVVEHETVLEAGERLLALRPDEMASTLQAMAAAAFALGRGAQAKALLARVDPKDLDRHSRSILRKLKLEAQLLKANPLIAEALQARTSGNGRSARRLADQAVSSIHAARGDHVLPRTLAALAGDPTRGEDDDGTTPVRNAPTAVFCAGFRWSGASAAHDFMLDHHGVASFWKRPRFLQGGRSSFDALLAATRQGGAGAQLALWRFVAEHFLGLTVDGQPKNPLQVHDRSILAQLPGNADLGPLDGALARLVSRISDAIDAGGGAPMAGELVGAMLHEISSLCSPGSDFLLFDSVIRAQRPDLLAVLPGARMVVMVRDPRDMYVTHVGRGRWDKGVDVYIEELGALLAQFNAHRPAAESSGALHVARFEAFVQDPAARQALLGWLGMRPRPVAEGDRRFRPEQSVGNIGVYRRFSDQAAIRKLEQAFPELCWDDGQAVRRPAPGRQASKPDPASSAVRVLTFSAMASKSQQQDRMGLAGLPGEPGWKVRRQLTVDLLSEGRYDFFGLQHCHADTDPELDAVGYFRDQLAARGLDYGVVNRSGGSNPLRGDSTPLYYLKQRWRLDAVDHGFRWFGVPVPEEQPGGGGLLFVYGVFHELGPDRTETGRRVFVCNTRLRDKHTAELDRYRLRCLSVLFSEVEARIGAGLPVVVLADTNCKKVDCLSDRYLRGSRVEVDGEVFAGNPRIHDALLSVDPALHGRVSTQHNFRNPGSVKGSERNDRILFAGPLRATDARLLTYNRSGNYPSYHYPVEAILEFAHTGGRG